MTQNTETDTEVRVERVVEAPIERAFSVFAEQCDAWWPRMYRLSEAERTDVRIEPRQGGRWFEDTADGGTCDWGRVRAWDPPHHVELTWDIDVSFAPEPDPGKASTVDVRFTAEGPDRTRVTLVHTDLERHGEDWESMRESVGGEGGWPGILDSYAAVTAATA
jgi:uncharacterized protein YndB with AHSA1/START domain